MATQTEHERRGGQAEIEVRQCLTVEEFEACVQLQRVAFNEPDIEISPRRHLIATRRAGGWTLGAFTVEQELVGFVHTMVGVRAQNEVIAYSHMMAVAAPYQNRGVGARLKWAQRERALREGRRYITWSWNPMKARNAHFNLNRLGVIASSFGVNFFGTDTDLPLDFVGAVPGQVGIDSDRIFADWELDSARVASLARGQALEQIGAPVKTIEIPHDWNALIKSDAAEARREQLRVREQFLSAFEAGLICAGFERQGARPRYLLYEKIAVNG